MKLLSNDGSPVFATNNTWSLFVGPTDVLASLKHHYTYPDGRVVWEALTPIHNGWLRIRAMAELNSSLVVFWAWFVAGDTGIPTPRFPRKGITLRSTSHLSPRVDYTICTSDSLKPDPENYGFTIGGLLHGQGITLRSFHVDFGQSSWSGDDAEFAPNDYCPVSPNRTGGEWAYMGLSYPVNSIRITDIYAIGGYSGFFQHADGGKLVEENDFPRLQAGSHIDSHSTDKGWIEYTDPRNTWRDAMGVFRTNPDGQHFCQVSVLAQMSMRYPKDEGLKMLLEAWSHVYTRQFPRKARGTTHANSGQERAQGRVMKAGVDAFLALIQDDGESALRFGDRAMDRFLNDKRQFLELEKQQGIGFAGFGSSNYIATNEVGIHYWGMWHLHQAVEELDIQHFEDVHFWLREAQKWCFHSFRFYDIQGNRKWSYPYFETKDHEDKSGSVTAEHFGWLAASHYEPQNPTELEKHKVIVALGEGMDKRFRR